MAISRWMFVITLLLVTVIGIRCAGDSIEAEQEIEKLKLKIASLESTCTDQEKEIKEKGERQFDLESNIQENSAQIASLSNEIDLLQKNGNFEDDELISKANAHHYMLQKQVIFGKIEKFEKELETQVQKREALEAKASEAEKIAQKLLLKLECIEKINEDQRQKIEEINHDLQRSQEELKIAKSKAKSQAKQLQELHGAWLPIWLTKRINPIKNRIIYSLEPHMRIASSKTSDMYEVCVDAMTPHYIKAKQSIKSYLHRMDDLLFRPYIANFERVYMYRDKVQNILYENLKQHELLRPIATQNIARILASFLFCVPLIVLFPLASSIFRRKRKSRRRGQGDTATRKHKRRHVDK